MPLPTMSAWTRFLHTLTGWRFWTVPDQDSLPADLWDNFMPEWYRTPIGDRPTMPVYGDGHEQWTTARSLVINAGSSSKVYKGSTQGTPYEIVTSKTPRRKVLELDRYGNNRLVHDVPVPNEPYIQNYPNPYGDHHWFGVDIENMQLWEAITFRPAIDVLGWGYKYQCTSIVCWDLTKSWDEQKARGKAVNAAQVPYLPFVLRYEEVKSGRIEHPLGGSLDNYMPCYVEPAISTDGRGWGPYPPDWAGPVQPQPVCAGDLLRLDEETTDYFVNLGGDAAVVATCLHEYGFYVTDLTGSAGLGSVWDAPDGRYSTSNINRVRAAITDFEVVEADGYQKVVL